MDEITYPFPNLNGCIVEVWEWINNFNPHFTGHLSIYRCWGLNYWSIFYLFTDLPPWAEQLRRTDTLQKPGDEHERRYREQIDELLATKTQQQHCIDELVTTQTHQQQQQHRLQQHVDELLSEREDHQRQINTLQQRNEELQDSLNCSICLTSDHQKIVFSCGHSACHMCSHEIGRCHMCRDPITDAIPLYLWVTQNL